MFISKLGKNDIKFIGFAEIKQIVRQSFLTVCIGAEVIDSAFASLCLVVFGVFLRGE